MSAQHTAETPAQVDPVTVQVIGNALLSVAEEAGTVLRRASYSTNIKERADCSTALFDAAGRLIAQAEHIPIHMGSMAGAVGRLSGRIAGYEQVVVEPGDVFITNDPYAGGGTHLPDITMVAPVHDGRRIVGWSANIAHHSDVGGHVPGSNSGDSHSLFMEGLRIPLVKIVSRGRVVDDVLAFVLLNSRLPEERYGDLLAQQSAAAVGAQRLLELHEKYGGAVVTACSEALLDYAERRLALAVSAVPDGRYTATDWLDRDRPGEDRIPIVATVIVEGDRIALDFAGTGREATVAVNVVRSALEATVFYALKAALDPGIPANGGFFDAVAISAPEGSILNPRPPAPVAARTDTCQRVVDAVFAALAQALPDRIPAGSHSSITYVNFSGLGDDFYVYPEVVAGGAGARPDADGLDAVQVHITNSSNLPIESLETEYPLMVEAYELVADSGGPGLQRGGLAIRRDIRILGDGAEFSAHADRQSLPPAGYAGGGDGTPGRFTVRPGESDEIVLPGGRVSGVVLRRGDVMRVQSPGAGGFGPPRRRDPLLVLRDVQDGRVTPESARADYGVVIADGAIDLEATAALRAHDGHAG
ncbi:hydantoinase B/oxoprolinase family protein [Microbacterium marinilacus]|uniref:Hydantoinase B/oxoprolinase family protein n=1 Tax=Microbacterium marinilacus TaxID=415209 RepID=A0ABP7BP21_9MICO|nr:hydantoinase B/oxoprolinase family protein [Microbacterium marinilacus]MBY0689798.1 hydantoinase B/oxoprolinase family protein [Microbacterium marinilacus]